MPGKLSTHVLDTAAGRPAAGVRLELHRLDGATEKALLADMRTDADGRAMLLPAERMAVGRYRLLFHIGDYFANAANADAKRFLDVVPVLFAIDDAETGYHVPLLISPWSYSTYRGS